MTKQCGCNPVHCVTFIEHPSSSCMIVAIVSVCAHLELVTQPHFPGNVYRYSYYVCWYVGPPNNVRKILPLHARLWKTEAGLNQQGEARD